MSSREFAEWMAFYRLEPFGYEMLDVHFATTEALIHNQSAKRSKQPGDFRLAELFNRSAGRGSLFDQFKAFFGGLKK